MKHIKTIETRNLCESAKKGGCGECQTSCQSACKTSCGIANQQCESTKVIRLSDNSLILMDGGAKYQATKEGTGELMSFLREITGTSEGEKIRISSIIITHAHSDHKKYVDCDPHSQRLWHSQ